MTRRALTVALAPAVALALAGGAAGCGGGGGPADAGAPDAPPLLCRPAVALGAGPYFTDVTAEVFGGARIDGNRLTLADLDGDGYPDLIAHPIVPRNDERGDRPALDVDPPIFTWRVLLNRPAPSGQGRVFVDHTIASGYGAARDGSPNRAAHFAVAGDFDDDGDLDLFSGYYADPPDFGDRNELFLNDGTGRFTLAPGGDLVGSSLPWHATAAAPLDYDGDGRLDVYVGFWYEIYGFLTGQQDRLYRNAGGGAFADVTSAAGLGTTRDGYAAGTNHRPTYGVAACDVDGDGDQDLLGAAYGRQWNQLFVNAGGQFTETGRASGYGSDADEDYSDNQFYRCWCQENPGACNPPPPAPVIGCGSIAWNPGVDDQPWRNGGNTFTTVCGDVDGDGDLDLYNAEIRHWHIGGSSDASELLVNDGAGAFTRPGNAATGLTIPHPVPDWNEGVLMAAFLDFDLDGHLDLYVAASDYPGNGGLLYRGRGDGTFEEIGQTAGVNHVCASGLAVGDVDGDGDPDLVVGSGRARNCADVWSSAEVHVYRNDVGQAGNALRLRLVGGAGTNRAAIGARVRVTAGGRAIRRDLHGAYGHEAIGNDLTLLVGLGDACEADVEVTWPGSSVVEAFQGVRANYLVELTQGGGVRYLP